MYTEDTDDHARAERDMHEELKKLYATMRQWNAEATQHNRHIALLQPVCDERRLAPGVFAAVEPALKEAKDGLHALFQCSNPAAPQLANAGVRIVVETPADLELAQKNLRRSLADLEEQAAQENEALRLLRRNRNKRAQQIARYRLNVPLDVANELDRINDRLDNKQREIDELEARLAGVQGELDILDSAWKDRQAVSDGAQALTEPLGAQC